MSAPTLAQLIVQETKAALYAQALSFAETVGLPVTSWQTGNPTRSLYHIISTWWAAQEQIAARYVAAHFLDLAAQLDDPQWLIAIAYEQFGYTAREATYATCTVQLTNTGAGVFDPIDAQSLTFAKTGDPNITYRNTTGGSLLDGSVTPTTLDLTVECEVAGSDGSAAPGDLTIVTSLIGVTATNITTATGIDAESATSIVAGCRAKLEALSPNGAAGAYAYVALNAAITGASDVTRVRVIDDSTTGDVIVYVASSSGAVSAPDLALVEAALVETALPFCMTLTCSSASALPVTTTITASVYDSVNATESEIKQAIVDAVGALFATIPIGGDGDDGKVFRARLISTVEQTFPGYVFDVVLAAPAADVALAVSQVATTGITTGDVTLSMESAP